MSSIIPPELLWLASGFIMLLAAFLASAAEYPSDPDGVEPVSAFPAQAR